VSLSGSVGDLPLLEILQVVAFTQKTGYLAVTAPEGDAGVVFREGRVVAGYIWDLPPLGAETQAFPAHVRQDAIRGRITGIVERLARLREGTFVFQVAEETSGRVGTRDLAEETLDDGINPEGLMLDLARQLDEDRRETSAVLEASLAVPPEQDEENLLEELVLEDAPSGPPVLLVDDEPDVRRLVGAQLATAGFDVVESADVRSGRVESSRLAGTGAPFVVVTDLGLPSLGGGNFRGGLEMVDHAARLESPPRILLMAESADERLRNKARRLGVSILALKPGLSKLDPLQYDADLRAFGRKLARDLVPRLLRRAASPAAGEAPLPASPPAGSPADEVARESALSSARNELARHPEPDLVAFLLLRAARAFFPRGLLFLVRDDRLRGLAGFGPTASGTSLDILARELSIGLDEPSPFAIAVAPGRLWSGSPPANGPTRGLLERIGAMAVSEIAVTPVRAQHETIAVLYGDAPDGQPLPALDPLADFANEAGRVLDEALLRRRGAGVPA
jgi:CheY-like chemotaxis protein